MRSNLVLKAELIRKFGRLADAAMPGIPAVRLTRVIHGAVRVRPEESARSHGAFKKSIDDLFPKEHA